MKNLPKTETSEVLCFSSMGNEPGLKTESRELTPAARAMRRREIDAAKDKNHKRQLLRSVPGEEASSAAGDDRQTYKGCDPGRGYEKRSGKSAVTLNL